VIRALIVDDEPLARERVRSLLSAERDVEIVRECATGKEAVAAVRELRPDLLFLDIQMPGMSGFDVLRELERSAMPLVIFVTAYDQHALKAFEVHALDYLLKPFKQARFQQTLHRAREMLSSKDTALASRKLLEFLGQTKTLPEYLTRLTVRTGERVVVVRVDQVDYFESAGNYVVVHTARENHVLRETLTALEQKLNPRQFLRISRSTLVNLDKIKELQPLFKGEHAVLLHSGKQLTMTRGLREVQELLKFA
jgi:two-component system LytT family response regulator